MLALGTMFVRLTLFCGRYNSLFCFLLRTARVQYGLQGAWTEQMWKLKTRRQADTTATYTRLSNLRAKMAFLVDNLQYYLHVDVSFPCV